MIPIEVLKQVATIYTHAHCPDGLASAMILKDAFRMLGMAPRIVFLAHGTEEHRRAGVDDDGVVLFCDICPHAAVADGIAGMQNAIVLDHHKGAEEIVEMIGRSGGWAVFADEKLEPGVSGAVLAFREVWQHVAWWMDHAADRPVSSAMKGAVSAFAACVGARDTWQTQDDRFLLGQWISKALMSKPADYWLHDTTFATDGPGGAYFPPIVHPPYCTGAAVEIGRALFEAHENAVRQAREQCVHYRVQPVGWEGPLGPVMLLYVFQEQASGFRLCSDVAESLRADHPDGVQAMVAGFAWVVDKPGAPPRLVWSLRGLGGFDVAAFAKAHGGGGHTAAAGFSWLPGAMSSVTPYAWIAEALRAYLERRSR